MSNRTLALIAAGLLVLGGMAATYAVPAAVGGDIWFGAHGGMLTTGFGVGLLLAFLGTSFALPYITSTRRKTRH